MCPFRFIKIYRIENQEGQAKHALIASSKAAEKLRVTDVLISFKRQKYPMIIQFMIGLERLL